VNMPLEFILVAWFVVFCRVGACIMMLPGFGGERVPVRVRLYIAVAVSAPIAVFLWPKLIETLSSQPLVAGVTAIVSETIIGLLIGVTCRMFLFATETMFTAVTLSIGLGNALGAPISESEPTPALTSFVVLGATALIFTLDLHLELLRGIKTSYDHVPPLGVQSGEAMLGELLNSLGDAFIVVLRIASPFLLFGLISNVAIAFLNKMTPQVPVYFAVTPGVIFGGLAFFYSLSTEALSDLVMEYAAWLTKG
jgi:flagellar biosynthesis protein FliR